ncbi:hypothetical protein BSKO_14108 [Bryopsis sp. KO-2023]|nr:hypothetical protein BSKO_14108 [Bryopsis sp. KO-2023]
MRLDSLSDDSWLSGGFRSLGVSVQKCELNRVRREGLARVKKQKKAAALRKKLEHERSKKKPKVKKMFYDNPTPMPPPSTADIESAPANKDALDSPDNLFSSKFVGVYCRGAGSFRARVHARGRDISLGGFSNERSAAEERDKTVLLMQLNTRLNFPGREYSEEELSQTKEFLKNRGLYVEGEQPTTDIKKKYRALGSKYVGVALCCKRNMFMARVVMKGRSPAIVGYYENEEDAARAHDIALMHFDYHKCKRNFPDATYTHAEIEEVRGQLHHCEIPSSMALRYSPTIKSYEVGITIGKEKIGLGNFKRKEDAARAFDLASLSLTGGNPVHLNYFGQTYDLIEVEIYRQKLKTELGSKRFEELRQTFCSYHSLDPISMVYRNQDSQAGGVNPKKLYGIAWDEDRSKWKVEIKLRVFRSTYRTICVGYYSDAIEAARAHDLAVIAGKDAVYEPLNFSQVVYDCEEVCKMRKKLDGILCKMNVIREKDCTELRFKDYINQVLSRTGKNPPPHGDGKPQSEENPGAGSDVLHEEIQEESCVGHPSEKEMKNPEVEECMHVGESRTVRLSASDIVFDGMDASETFPSGSAELWFGEEGASQIKSDPGLEKRSFQYGASLTEANMDIDPADFGKTPIVKMESEDQSFGLPTEGWVPNFIKKETGLSDFGGGFRAKEGFVNGVASLDGSDRISGFSGKSAVVKREGAMIHSKADIAQKSMIH